MKRDAKAMFASMSPWRLFFVTALPGMISMFTMSIYSTVEGVFIGQKLGEAALAVSVALVFPALLLACLWQLGLNGIWMNLFGTAVLAAVMAIFLLKQVWKHTEKGETSC